jgi:surface polysaccharide O-acyltransferase-like enzyme
MNSSQDRLAFLDSYRALGIVLVIALHSLPFTKISEHYVQPITSATSIAVPIFFLVDGYLFMRLVATKSDFSYTAYLKRSTKRLMLPWVVFSFGYAAFRLLAEYLGYAANHKILGEPLGKVLSGLYFSTFAGHMYFLLSLYLVRAIAGHLSKLAVMPSWVSIAIFLGYALVYNVVNPPAWFWAVDGNDPVLHFLWGMQYYLLGVAMFLYMAKIRMCASSLLILCIGLFIAGEFLVSSPRLAQYGNLGAAFIVFMLFPKLGGLHHVGRQTMGIYLIHYPVVVMLVAFTLAMIWRKDSIGFLVLLTSVTTLLSLGGTHLIMMIPYGNYLFGLPKPILHHASTHEKAASV